MFKKSESKRIKQELANHIDERNKKITKKIITETKANFVIIPIILLLELVFLINCI